MVKPCLFELARDCLLMGRATTSEMCRKCGGCCRNFPFVELSDLEIRRLSEFTGLEAAAFSDSNREPEPRRFLKFQASGSCVFLKEDAAGFCCSVYEARPGICRSYPFSPVEDKVCEATWLKVLEED